MIFKIRRFLRSQKNSLYNPNLIEKLHKDHQKLLNLFIKLENKPTINNFNNFIKELELHLLLEDTNLYHHLEIKYSLCKINTIKEVKEKITEIIPKLEKVENLIKLKASKKSITPILKEIKKYLLNRIHLEEDLLFSLYENVYKCEKIEKELKPFKEL